MLKAFKKEMTMFAVMVALAIITAVLNPLFLGGDNLRNNVRHISLISLFALGEAMVIIAGGIDLSIGSIICVTAITTSYLAMYAGFGIGAAVAIALGVALVIGVVQGAMIARFGMPPFVVTLGSMLLLRGVAEVLTGGCESASRASSPASGSLGEGRRPRAADAVLVRGRRDRRSSRSSCTGPCSGATATRSVRTPRRRGCRASRSRPSASLTFVASAVLSGVAGMLYVAYLPTATPSLGQRVRAARGRGRGARRLFVAGGEGVGVRRADRRRHPADHVQRREPGRASRCGRTSSRAASSWPR